MKKLTPLFIALLMLGACKKTTVAPSVPVKFTSTSYTTLGTYDAAGEPSYLTTKDVVSANLVSYLSSTLPEHTDLRNSHPELLSSSASVDIKITQKSNVAITFVSQGTGISDALGFYTYPTNNPPASAADIKTITYIFPSVGLNTPLQPGDKVNIGSFEAGTSIGFVLMQNGWSPTSKSVVNDAVHFCSNPVLNPEVDPNLKKHAVLINYTPENKVLIGFEDLDRTDPRCDNDFNDVVVYATITQ
ncbi:DUF4114 domain-containing protein [uncultured Mucilaginibacter sp.]|uniref:DUF4114 domain-containing protein n=1 Tax=uncultured Mucilaginibacter sp. TaxID=797541 RepID=UPI00262A841E|nr:DUF4114 domain-containing protein [uncultured Mucilaginibacter sp.]